MKDKSKKKNYSTTKKVVMGFFITIIIGTLLLLLPWATVEGQKTTVVDAFFTSTTSVCVTGLVTVDSFSHWTIFGKIIILCLIQLGGLGIVTLTSTMLLVLNKKVTLKDRMLIQDAYNLNTMQGLIIFTKKVIIGTFIVEGIGAVLYSFCFIPRFGLLKGIWFSVFHSVSAFCNAGIDIIGPSSMGIFYDNPYILIVTMMLIFMGGIGFVVWWDIIRVSKSIKKGDVSIRDFMCKLTAHTRIVLIATFALIFVGGIMIFAFEYSNPLTIGNMSLTNKISNSFFQSVTLRTAGFASFSQANMTEPSFIVSILYMFIGGSPGGAAGGIKTMTIAVVFLTVVATVNGRFEVVVYNKKIPLVVIRKAMAVTFISFFALIFFVMLLILTNPMSIKDGLFEVTSAIGTVGLSRNITPTLNSIGKIIIIITMYLGRIGPISMAIAFNAKDNSKNLVHYPEGNFIVG